MQQNIIKTNWKIHRNTGRTGGELHGTGAPVAPVTPPETETELIKLYSDEINFFGLLLKNPSNIYDLVLNHYCDLVKNKKKKLLQNPNYYKVAINKLYEKYKF